MLRGKEKKLIKRGRRIYGGIFELKDGCEVYVAFRKQAEMFRCGRKTNSDAAREKIIAWALDESTLLDLRAQGVEWVGFEVKENGDLYLTSIENYWDTAKAKIMNFTSRGGAIQRYLPIHGFFSHRLGSTRIR